MHSESKYSYIFSVEYNRLDDSTLTPAILQGHLDIYNEKYIVKANNLQEAIEIVENILWI